MILLTKIKIGYLSIFLAILNIGCVSNAKVISEIKPGYIEPNTNVGVVWISPCSANRGCSGSAAASNLGQFTPDGANGLLIYGAVMSAHSDVIEALDEVSADPLVEEMFLNPISSTLETKGAIPKVNKGFYYQGDIPIIGKASFMPLKKTLNALHPEGSGVYRAAGVDRNFDLSAIADELDSTVLVVLDLQYYGVRRSFGPFGVPLGRPFGVSLARALVWDANTKSVLYNDYGIARSSIGGNWREPDHWTKVHTATNTALEMALERAVDPLITALQ